MLDKHRVKNHDKTTAVDVASQFHEMGFKIMATRGTFMTIAGANAICKGIAALIRKKLSVKCIQEYI